MQHRRARPVQEPGHEETQEDRAAALERPTAREPDGRERKQDGARVAERHPRAVVARDLHGALAEDAVGERQHVGQHPPRGLGRAGPTGARHLSRAPRGARGTRRSAGIASSSGKSCGPERSSARAPAARAAPIARARPVARGRLRRAPRESTRPPRRRRGRTTPDARRRRRATGPPRSDRSSAASGRRARAGAGRAAEAEASPSKGPRSSPARRGRTSRSPSPIAPASAAGAPEPEVPKEEERREQREKERERAGERERERHGQPEAEPGRRVHHAGLGGAQQRVAREHEPIPERQPAVGRGLPHGGPPGQVREREVGEDRVRGRRRSFGHGQGVPGIRRSRRGPRDRRACPRSTASPVKSRGRSASSTAARVGIGDTNRRASPTASAAETA